MSHLRQGGTKPCRKRNILPLFLLYNSLRHDSCSGMALALYLFGIGVHSLFPFARMPDWVWWMVIPVLTAGIGFVRWRRLIIFLCAFLFGFWRFDVSLPRVSDGVMSQIGEEVSVTGRVASISSYGRGKMLLVTAPGTNISVSYFQKSDIRIGSTVAVNCVLKESQDPNLARRGVFATCGGKTSVTVRGLPDRFDVVAMLSAWHGWLTQRITALFPTEEGTLITGILYGDQSLSSDQRDLMQRAGLMHIVAVSGSNVTIVVSVLMAVVLACGFRRRHAFYVVTFGIIVFTLFVGSSSSVVRAAIMGWLVLLARHVGRAPKPSRILFLSAVGLATLNPWVLGFDAGFALSFLATWGLMVWTPIITEHVSWIPERFGLRETFATTAGATLMTLPYMGWVFGRMSFAGLLTNMLALPLVPFIMLWGAVAGVIGPMIPLATIPAYGLTLLLERVAHLADLVPLLDVHLEQMDAGVMIGLYVLMAWIWFVLRGKTELSTKMWVFFHSCCQPRR